MGILVRLYSAVVAFVQDCSQGMFTAILIVASLMPLHAILDSSRVFSLVSWVHIHRLLPFLTVLILMRQKRGNGALLATYFFFVAWEFSAWVFTQNLEIAGRASRFGGNMGMGLTWTAIIITSIPTLLLLLRFIEREPSKFLLFATKIVLALHLFFKFVLWIWPDRPDTIPDWRTDEILAAAGYSLWPGRLIGLESWFISWFMIFISFGALTVVSRVEGPQTLESGGNEDSLLPSERLRRGR